MESDKCARLLQASGKVHTVDCLLGTGSFSHVFRCTMQDDPETFVAVKALKAKDYLPGRGREAEFIARLRHENLVNMLEILSEPEIDFFVCELCHGGSMQDLLYGNADNPWGHVPLRQRALAGYDIANALQFLHSQEVLHRDVKSGNAFLSTQLDVAIAHIEIPRLKLGDMGFARPIDEFDVNMTQGVGTMRYMAPEVISSGDYGVKADAFSLGILMHELLSGKLPYDKRSEASVCMAVMDGIRPDLDDVRCVAGVEDGELTNELIRVLEESWSQDQFARLSCDDMKDQIARILQT